MGFALLAFLGWRKVKPEGRANIRAALSDAFDLFAGVYSFYQQTVGEFRSAAPDPPSWETLALTIDERAELLRACLHTLARSTGGDHSAAELAKLLPQLPVAQGEAKVRALLREESCFHEAWKSRWQVGTTADEFAAYRAYLARQHPGLLRVSIEEGGF
jgi:hypothetical protein